MLKFYSETDCLSQTANEQTVASFLVPRFGSTSFANNSTSLTRKMLHQYARLISDYSDELDFDRSLKLFNQITYTISEESWNPEDQLPDVESLIFIIEFLIDNPELETPFLTTDGSGYFNAVWQKDRQHRVSIDFLPNKKARWAFVSLENKESMGGTTLSNKLIKRLKSLGIVTWME